MSIWTKPATQQAQNNVTATVTRKQGNIYLNIGYSQEYQDNEGNTQVMFVSLPFGLDLENMPELQLQGNEFSQQLAEARNELLKSLLKASENLAPKSGQIITDLEVQLFKRDTRSDEEKKAQARKNNPFLR